MKEAQGGLIVGEQPIITTVLCIFFWLGPSGLQVWDCLYARSKV